MSKVVKKDSKHLHYRLAVGLMILNRNCEVFVGKRIDTKIEAWQMPQGGIDDGEKPEDTALREMEEEIGTGNGKIIAESKKWYSYDLPAHLIPKLWGGKYKGQTQKWFLIQFLGEDSEININKNKNPEFIEWRWTNFEELSSIIIPFKKKLYLTIMEEFKERILELKKNVAK